MRPHSTTLCGRCRFVSLLAIMARGSERLPWVPLSAALHFDLADPSTA